MRIRILAPLIAFALQGCFTSMLIDDIKNSAQRDDSVLVKHAPGLRGRICPRIGSGFRIDADSRPLYLHTDSWKLTDDPTDVSQSHPPEGGAKSLEVVMGTSPDGFFPSDLDGETPSVFLQYPSGVASSGADSGQMVGDGGFMVMYWRWGAIHWDRVEIRTNRLIERRRQAKAFRESPWFLVTLPADIVLSPLELPLWLFVRGLRDFPVGCTGNCH